MEIVKVRFLAEDGYSGGIPDIVNPTERIKYDTRNPINELIAWPYKVFFCHALSIFYALRTRRGDFHGDDAQTHFWAGLSG